MIMKKYLLRTIMNIKLFAMVCSMCLFALYTNAQVTHSTLTIPAGNIAPGSNNNVIYGMQINNLAPFPYTPTSITFTTSGNYVPGDLVFDPSMFSLPIKVYQSNSSTFSVGTATLLGQTLSSANGIAGETITNLVLTGASSISFNLPRYLFITVDIDVEFATLGHTFKINGATNPVQINYLSFEPIPPGITNNQSDLAGIQTISNAVTPPTPTSLVANYTFCNNANDVTSNANNATVSGASLTFDRFGLPNSAYNFDGVDDYIEAPSNGALQLGTSDYSFSYWFKTNSSNSPLATIMKNEPAFGYSGIGSYINYPNTGSVYVRSMNSEQLNTVSPAYNDNNWHFVTYTRSGNIQKLYVDNILKETNSSFSPSNISNGKPLTFGSFNDGHQQFFMGALDDVKIYAGALSETEIANEFNATSTAGCMVTPCPTITVSVGVNFSRTCDGQATFTASGGTESYSYSIVEGTGGAIDGITLTGLGSYSIQATDANGCTGSISVTLTKNDDIAPTFTNCPANITETADANCTKVVSWPMLAVTDNCSNNFPIPAVNGFQPKGTFNNSHYYFSNDAYYWEDSKAAALAAGGNIAAITSEDEHNFIKTLPFGAQYTRIGLTDEETEGTYKWSSGEPFAFSAWNGGEPNNGNGGNEDYVQITTSDSKWNDVSDINTGFLFEKSVFTITQTAGLPSGSAFPIGETTNTFEVTDAAGNKSTCSFTVTINPSVTATIDYTSTPICTNGVNITPSITGAQGGSFSAQEGLVFVNNLTGEIDVSESVPATYIVTYTILATDVCPAIIATDMVIILAKPIINNCPTNLEVCKNSPEFALQNIPDGAIVTVGGVANTTGLFDPSATFTGYYDGDGNANVPVVYTLTGENGCTNTCSYFVKVKRLPNAISTVVPEVNGQTNGGQTVNICKNSAETVNALFVGGTGSMAPITFYYTLNGGTEQEITTGASQGGINVSTATAGSYVYHLTKVKINTGCESEFDVTATVNIIDLPVTTLTGGASYCQGENTATTLTITSSATGSISGTLSDGTAFSGTSPVAVTVTPSQTSTYTIASINTGLCNGNNSGSATVTIKNLPNDNTGMYFIDGNNFGVQTYTVCQNSPNVTLRFDQGIGNTGPFIFYYTLNNGPEQSTSSNGNSDFSIPTTTTGQSVYKLTRVSANGCERNFDITTTLNVKPVTNVSISGPSNAVYCEGANTATTLTITSSVAGTISGTISDGSAFSGTSPITVIKSPSQTTTYTIATVNGAACPGTNSGIATIIVNPKPVVTCPLDMSVCISANSFSPLVSPAGGNFSGDGIDDNVFNPALAGVGTHEITYSYTDENTGCTNACTFNITVTSSTLASLTYPSPSVCKSETSFAATLVGTGGNFSVTPNTGLSIASNGDINPSASTAGVYTVKYTIPASGDCAAVEASASVEIKASPVVACPETISVCQNTLPLALEGDGVFTGDGVTFEAGSYIFNPSIGAGGHTITLSKTVDGCTSSCDFLISISNLPSVAAQLTGPSEVCENNPTGFQFVGVGTFQGATGFTVKYKINDGETLSTSAVDGIAVVNLNTSIPGDYAITFVSVKDDNGMCESNLTGGLLFLVKPKPTAPTCPANMSKTTDDSAFALSGASPTGGVYSGIGVSAGMFNPATAGVGVHTITYLITGENGCQNTCTFTIAVTTSTVCTSTASISYPVANSCQSGASIPPTLVGTAGGEYSALPAGLNINASSGIISPLGSLPGNYVVSYTLAATANCPEIVATAEISIQVTPTLSGFTAESVCQPFAIPLTFSGLVPNSVNEIKLGVKEVLIPANAYGDRTVTVTADAGGLGSITLDVSGYQTVEYQLIVKEVKIGGCTFIPENKTANFNKKPRGGGQTVDITETAICNGGGTLNGVLGTVANAGYPTNFTYQIWNTTTNQMVLNGTGIATPLAASTLQFNIPSVVLPAGSYQFRIISQDIDGCGITAAIHDNFTVLPTPVLTAMAVITNLDCNNSLPSGAIDQNISGGSGTYTFAWSNNATTEDITGLAVGDYTVTITDQASCGSPTLVKNYTVTKPNAIVVNAASITSECNGNNGTATLSATGGNGGFSFTANYGGAVDMAAFTGLAGTYTITATDIKGCTGTLILTITNCEDFDVICTTTQNGYGNAQFTACQPDGSTATVGSLMANALNGSPYVFGIQANNRTFTLSPLDLTSNIYSMLSGVSNASSKFGLGGASYSVGSSWSKVPLTNTGKIANNLFAHSMALYFNLQNSAKLDQVTLNSAILNTESTLNCGSETGSGVVSSYQLPTGVVSFLNNSANGYSATVSGLFQLNNDALGGKTGLPNLSTLAAAADKVNKAFNGCRLLASLPANTATFGTNITVNEGNKGFDAPAKGGLYMTLIEGNSATGHILGVVEVGKEGTSGFAPVITNNYHVIMGTDPEGSRTPQAPPGYRIVSQIVNNGTAGFTGQGTQTGSGEVEIGNYNPQAGSRVAAAAGYEITFVLEPSGPLPVRLISFTGKSTEKGNELNWKASSETNFSHYEVERSNDAKIFEMIGKVDGAGNTNEKLSYDFVDNSPLTPGGGIFSKSSLQFGSQPSSNTLQSTPPLGAGGPSAGLGLYYRLKLIDLDGKIEFSKVIYLNKAEEAEIKVYPNPATDFINIENLDGKSLNIKVLDGLGREIIGQTKTSENNVKIPIRNVSTGTYFIQIQDQKQTIYRKVIVNK
jgi:hypothetical protein